MAHILVVDDDGDLCALLKAALERDGHQVSACRDGQRVDGAAGAAPIETVWGVGYKWKSE